MINIFRKILVNFTRNSSNFQTIFLNKTRSLLYTDFTVSALPCCYGPQPYAPQEQMWVLLWWVVNILNSSLMWAPSYSPLLANWIVPWLGLEQVYTVCAHRSNAWSSAACLPKTDRIKCHGWEPIASRGVKGQEKHQPEWMVRKILPYFGNKSKIHLKNTEATRFCNKREEDTLE